MNNGREGSHAPHTKLRTAATTIQRDITSLIQSTALLRVLTSVSSGRFDENVFSKAEQRTRRLEKFRTNRFLSPVSFNEPNVEFFRAADSLVRSESHRDERGGGSSLEDYKSCYSIRKILSPARRHYRE